MQPCTIISDESFPSSDTTITIEKSFADSKTSSATFVFISENSNHLQKDKKKEEAKLQNTYTSARTFLSQLAIPELPSSRPWEV
jgi:hypothetical protein